MVEGLVAKYYIQEFTVFPEIVSSLEQFLNLFSEIST